MRDDPISFQILGTFNEAGISLEYLIYDFFLDLILFFLLLFLLILGLLAGHRRRSRSCDARRTLLLGVNLLHLLIILVGLPS